MVRHRICLNCDEPVHAPDDREAWLHADGRYPCRETYAAPGRAYTPRVQWEAWVSDIIAHYVEHPRRFTTDPIWNRLEALSVPPPLEPRLMGVVLRAWAAEELIVPTGVHVVSSRPVRHRRPLREWAPAKRQGALLVSAC